MSIAKKDSRGIAIVIEDEDDARRFSSRVLELEGFEVLNADSAEKGLVLAQQNRCAVVLLDLRLPGMDGWSVLGEMKANPCLSSVPVIVFSASANAAFKDRAFGMGATDYLVKPLSAAGLKGAVERVLNLRR